MDSKRVKELAMQALRGKPVGCGDGDTFVPNASVQSIEQAIRTALTEAFAGKLTTAQCDAIIDARGWKNNSDAHKLLQNDWRAMSRAKSAQWECDRG